MCTRLHPYRLFHSSIDCISTSILNEYVAYLHPQTSSIQYSQMCTRLLIGGQNVISIDGKCVNYHINKSIQFTNMSFGFSHCNRTFLIANVSKLVLYYHLNYCLYHITFCVNILQRNNWSFKSKSTCYKSLLIVLSSTFLISLTILNSLNVTSDN